MTIHGGVEVYLKTKAGAGFEEKALELLLPLESAARLNERMHRKVQADYGEDCFNRGALMIGKMVFVVLAHQR